MASNLNQRAQTGNLQETGLIPGQTIVDSYVRPQQNRGAGQDLLQLGAALEGLNPGIGAIMGKMAAADQQAADEAKRKKAKDEYQAGQGAATAEPDPTKRLALIAANRGQWTPERIQGAESIDAQQHSNLLATALPDYLKQQGLWNNEKASPAQVQQALNTVVADYQKRGEGNGPEWQAIFAERSTDFVGRTLESWVKNIGQVREVGAVNTTMADYATQITAHLGWFGTPETAAKFIGEYSDKTGGTFMDREHNNIALTEGFNIAVGQALVSGKPELAERIMATFQKVQTDKSGNNFLSKTADGTKAVQQMSNQLWQFNARYEAEEAKRRENLKYSVLNRWADLQEKERQRGRLPSQMEPYMPDAQLRHDMDSLGMDSTDVWNKLKEQMLVPQKLADEQRLMDSKPAIEAVEEIVSGIRGAAVVEDLQKVAGQLAAIDTDPQYAHGQPRVVLNNAKAMLRQEQLNFGTTGQVGSQNFVETENDLRRWMATNNAAGSKVVSDYQSGMTPEFMKKFTEKYSFNSIMNADGTSTSGFSDIDRKVMDAWVAKADSIQGKRRAGEVTREEWIKGQKEVIDSFAPQYEQRVQDIQKELSDMKKDREGQGADSNTLDNSVISLATNQPIVAISSSGLVSDQGLSNVKSSASSWAYLSAKGGASGANPLETVDTVRVARQVEGMRNVAGLVSTMHKETGFTAAMNSLFGVDTDWSKWAKNALGTQAAFYSTLTDASDPRFVSPSGLGYKAGTSPAKEAVNALTALESDKKLMEAVNQSAMGKGMSPYKPELQTAYANLRTQVRDSLGVIGIPTEVSTGESFMFKPEWVDWRTVPMFTYASDITPENAKKAMANMKLNPQQIRDFMDVQWALAIRRADYYAIPKTREPKK